MAILQCTNSIVGTVGITPNMVFIDTNDTAAAVQAAGYLNTVIHEGLLQVSGPNTKIGSNRSGDVALVNTTTGPLWFTISITGVPPSQVYSLVPVTQAGGSIFAGNVQAGSSGVQGYFISYPPTAANGTFIFEAANNVNNFASTLSNSAVGQATVYTIPDPGAATANLIISASAGTQHITTGNLSVDTGNLLAGSSGHAGTVSSFSGTAARGSLILAAVANTGATNTTISNVAMGQASVISIPDPANAIGRFLIGATATPFTANHSLVASGTGGLVADAGYQMKTVAQAAVAGGAAAQTVVDAFCTAASMVVASWNDTSNAVEIETVAAGNGSFVVTSTGDPGASHINYIITKV